MRSFITLARGATFDSFFDKENIELVNRLGQAVWNQSNRKMTADEVAERIGDCDNYVTLWGSPRLDAEILKKLRSLNY